MVSLCLNSRWYNSKCNLEGKFVNITSWKVEASSGANSGYRFIGSGAGLTYEPDEMSTPCSYGGLTYGYTTTHARFWQPGLGNGVSNGALICLSHVLAEGTNQQATHDGVAYVKQWELGKRIFCT